MARKTMFAVFSVRTENISAASFPAGAPGKIALLIIPQFVALKFFHLK